MTVHRLAVCAVLAMTVAACSGDDDAAPSTLPPPVTDSTTTSTTSTLPPPTTPETTEPAPETSPPTLPAEPTTTESSTPPDEDQIKQDVIDATVAAWTAFNAMKLDPTNDELLADVAHTRQGEALERAVEIAVDYRAKNQAERTHPEFPANVIVDEQTVSVDLERGTAAVEYCRLASNLWVELGSGSDGTDRVLDDSVSSYLEQDMLVLLDGRWVKTSGVSLAKYEGEVLFPQSG